MPTYVIGHKNPDTDAICSALAYAHLLSVTGSKDVEAARCGEVGQRTAFALEKAGVCAPRLIMDVRPTAGQVCCRDLVTAGIDDSLLESFEKMRGRGIHSVPVVDQNRRVQGMLSLFKMVELLLPSSQNKANARLVHSSLQRIGKGLAAEFQNEIHIDREEELILVVSALSEENFAERLRDYRPEKLIVVTGDRPTIQQIAIEAGIRALIITGGNRLNNTLCTLACENEVVVIVSSYDTAATTLLIKCAMRMSNAMETQFLSFEEETPLEVVLQRVDHEEQPIFPVVNMQGEIVGTISKSDLIDPPKTRLVLVDHNEFGQAVHGAETAEILEVLDHHRLGGGLTSKMPIRFINEPVGSTCTIVSLLFRHAGIAPEPWVALLLASGIIADTLHLTSPTTTGTDTDIMKWLQTISPVDFHKYADDFFAAGSLLQSATPEQAVRTDCKEYNENGWRFLAAQVEEQTLDDFWKHREALRGALEALRQEKSLDFACLLITDITRHYSVLQVTGNPQLIARIGYHKLDERLFELEGIVSRKKQLLPHLINVMGQVRRN